MLAYCPVSIRSDFIQALWLEPWWFPSKLETAGTDLHVTTCEILVTTTKTFLHARLGSVLWLCKLWKESWLGENRECCGNSCVRFEKLDCACTDSSVAIKHACGVGRLHTIRMYNPDSLHCNATVNVGQGTLHISFLLSSELLLLTLVYPPLGWLSVIPCLTKLGMCWWSSMRTGLVPLQSWFRVHRVWQVFGIEAISKQNWVRKLCTLRMVKTDLLSFSSAYSGFCTDKYSKVFIQDSCWSLCLLSQGRWWTGVVERTNVCLVCLFCTLCNPFVLRLALKDTLLSLDTTYYSQTQGDLKISC
jgi:hypothetical protein